MVRRYCRSVPAGTQCADSSRPVSPGRPFVTSSCLWEQRCGAAVASATFLRWFAGRLWREQPQDDADTEKLHGDSYSYIGNGGALDLCRPDGPVIRRDRSPAEI